jgi:hypothetical protein
MARQEGLLSYSSLVLFEFFFFHGTASLQLIPSSLLNLQFFVFLVLPILSDSWGVGNLVQSAGRWSESCLMECPYKQLVMVYYAFDMLDEMT